MTPRTAYDTPTAVRALAASLLDEALTLLGARPVPLTLPVRPVAATGHPLIWDAAAIRTALQAFAARTGRAPGLSEWRWATGHALPSRATVVRVYGTLEAAYTASGLVRPASRRGRATS